MFTLYHNRAIQQSFTSDVIHQSETVRHLGSIRKEELPCKAHLINLRIWPNAQRIWPIDSLCETADEQLFLKLIKNKHHLLRSLLPPQREQHYKLRDWVHNFQLPARTSSTIDSGFITRMLYINSGCASWLTSCTYLFYSVLFSFLLCWLLLSSVLSAILIQF